MSEVSKPRLITSKKKKKNDEESYLDVDIIGTDYKNIYV